MSMKIISLDVWNTLFWSNPSYAKYRTQYLSEELDLPENIINKAYYKTKETADSIIEKGEHVSDELAYYMFLKTLDRQDYTWKYLRYNIELLFEEYPPIVPQKIIDCLKKLQDKGIKLSIASNTVFTRGEVLNRVMFDHWGIDWSFQIYSDKVNVSKPHPKFWSWVTDSAYLTTCSQPEEILHIGDNKITDGSCIKYNIQFRYNKNPDTLVDTLENLKYE